MPDLGAHNFRTSRPKPRKVRRSPQRSVGRAISRVPARNIAHPQQHSTPRARRVIRQTLRQEPKESNTARAARNASVGALRVTGSSKRRARKVTQRNIRKAREERARGEAISRFVRQTTAGKVVTRKYLNPIAAALDPVFPGEGRRKVNAAGQEVEWKGKSYQPKNLIELSGTANTPAGKGAQKVLKQTLRPVHAEMGAAKAAFEGKNPASAFKKGLIDNKPTGFRDVVKAATGKDPGGTVGLIGDIALDPTTYFTAGRNVPAKLGTKAITKGAKKGGTRVGLRAGIPLTDKSVDVGVAVRAPKKVRKATERVRETKTVQGLGETFVHDFRPAGRTQATHDAIRTAQRRHRAAVGATERKAVKRKRAVVKTLSEPRSRVQKLRRKKPVPRTAEQNAIVDAIEAGTVHELPDNLRVIARDLESQFAKEFKAKKDSGLLETRLTQRGEGATGYVPHINRVEFEDAAKGRRQVGVTRVAPEKQRGIDKTLAVVRKETPELFEGNLAKVISRSAEKTGKKVALHEHWQAVVKEAGRKVEGGKALDLKAGEQVYELTPRGPKLLDKKERQSLVNGGREGEHVVLNEKDVKDIETRLSGVSRSSEHPAGRTYDRVQGKLKWAVTVPNPSYHARNLYGDTMNAWLGDASAKSMGQSVRAIRVQRAKSKALETFGDSKEAAKAQRLMEREIRIGKEKSTIGRELELAEREGAIKTGQIGAELRELGVKRGPITRASEYREDIGRFASYLSARKRGMDPSNAADWSLKHHFDYSDLTKFEQQVARRVIPFWTFFARNTRLQAGKLATRPGKLATQAKVFDAAAQAAGFGSYEAYLSDKNEYQQRGLPFPVKVDGKVYNVYLYPTSTDLQQVSTLSPGEQFENLMQRVTFFKMVPELVFNYSAFFRGPIQDDKSPLVPAPDRVASLPGPLKRKLGVKQYYDKRSGKRIWGWPGKVDYVARFLPQTNVAIGASTSVKGSRGQSAQQQVAGWLTGVKVAENRPVDNKVNRLYDALEKVQNRKGARAQQLQPKPVRLKDGSLSQSQTTYMYDAEYRRIAAEEKKLNQEIGRLRTQRKDARVPSNQRPPKSKVRRGAPSGPDPYGLLGGGGSSAPTSANDPYGLLTP